MENQTGQENTTPNQQPNSGPRRHRLTLIAIAVVLCAAATIFACKPGLLKSSFSQWLLFDRSAEAVQVAATAEEKLNVYSASSRSADVLFTIDKDSRVSVEENADSHWVEIKTAEGKTGWVERTGLKFPSVPSSSSSASSQTSPSSSAQVSSSQPPVSSNPPDPDAVTVSLKEASAPLSVKVSIAKQRVLVLDAQNRVVQNYICSSGKKGDDTPTGTFTVSERGESFYNKAINEGAYYWTRFKGVYLFHSVPFDEKRNMEPEEAAKLGTAASHGCIRLSVENAKWIYDHIPAGTKVVIEP